MSIYFKFGDTQVNSIACYNSFVHAGDFRILIQHQYNTLILKQVNQICNVKELLDGLILV